ncbi:MAG TPA: beta-N-acetylhexosaminidase [Pseudobdellovibrionaceae bacterium]|nr:beta-N-acetylhexosaminidase [Pseudobdellovibrionaceae bacterium]
MREKIGQCMIIGINGTSLTADETDFIARENIGGIILMKRNFSTPEELHELTREIQSIFRRQADRAPLFIGVDQEGGRVARFRAPFTEWPPLAALGKLQSPTLAFNASYRLGLELVAFGVNLNFAPCLDILTNSANTVIGDRALSSDMETVSKLGSACVRGFMKSGVLPVGKHFPGHGNTLLDSHEDLPVESRALAELEAREIEPFKRAIKARLPMLLSAHVKFTDVDADLPASLSAKWLKDILRGKLRWRGVTVSDDLDMKALTKHFTKSEIAVKAFAAGNDILLYCNEPDSHQIALDAVEKAVRDKQIPLADLMAAHQRVLELKREHEIVAQPKPLPEATELMGHELHQRLSQAIRAGQVPADLLEASGPPKADSNSP